MLATSTGRLTAAKGKVPELTGGVILETTLWSCTTCSACVDVCPVGVDPLSFITDMRRHLIGEGRFRGAPATALQKMDRAGNPWGLPAQDRMAWAAGLPVPLATGESDFDVLYWVGCAASYDRRIQKVARSVAQLLLAADVRFAVLGPDERCTGESARRMGDEFLFQQLATKNMETLARCGVKRGAKTIVSHCPHCVNSFKQDYSQLGVDYEVLHHTEFLAKLVAEKRLRPATASDADHGGVTYHDPCYLARVGGVTEPPRQLLQIASGADATQPLAEMPRNREQTACCGAGGGRMWFDDAPADRVGTGRVQEALDTGAKTVAVSCPFCLMMMTDGLAARDSSAQVKDVAEILLESLTARTIS
jgi:Fe-S oxidoreductase